MSPGANLSHATRCALDAQRALLAAAIHLEAADAFMTDLDQRLVAVDLTDADIAAALEELGTIAGGLQSVVDRYGHDEVARRMAAPTTGRAATCGS